MIVDARSLPVESQLQADICIVGAGAAGIPLALTLAEAGFAVLLLESGLEHPDARTQSLYAGEVVNEALHSPPDKYRSRVLGGSTRIWGGRCVPFDPIDFEPRPFIPLSGWPISYDDVAAFYPRANTWSEAGQYQYDADAIFADKPLFRGFSSSLVQTNSLERFSCPTNFGKRYRKRLQSASTLTLVLGANCTAVRLHAGGSGVSQLQLATLAGRTFSATADMYVLAAGGLENARLLLASRDVVTCGIGNEHDVVGRYYMCHLAGSVGQLIVNGPITSVRHSYEVSPDGIYCRRRISAAPAEQRRRQLLNMVARLHFPRIADPSHRNAVLSGLYLVRSMIRYEYGRRLNDADSASWGDYAGHVRNVLTGPLETIGFLTHWLTRRTLAERKFPSVILRNASNRFSLEINSEQTPLADSRVTLIESKDALGMPRLRVDWRYSTLDVVAARRTLELFQSEFARTGVGALTFDPDSVEPDLVRFGAYGGHHIGTTRMGHDLKTSVVDNSCRIHSVDNLYIAGSSVFPTSSQANPTLTIVALALRLAGHLESKLRR
jgi:choline dehydrogenase-like flavoprotein